MPSNMEQKIITNQGIFLKMIPDGQGMKYLIFSETPKLPSPFYKAVGHLKSGSATLLQDMNYEMRR